MFIICAFYNQQRVTTVQQPMVDIPENTTVDSTPANNISGDTLKLLQKRELHKYYANLFDKF